MKKLFRHVHKRFIKILKLSHEEWSNLINYLASDYEKKFSFFSFNIITNDIVEYILGYMNLNKIDFIHFIDCFNENVKLDGDIEELIYQVQEELGYILRTNSYGSATEMIDLSKKVAYELSKQLSISHDEWAEWVNNESLNYPLKINLSNFNSAVDFISQNIFEDLEAERIDFLSIVDCNNKQITIQTNKNQIAMQVETELSHQIDPKYGKV
jgi:hypothetical protein